MDTARLRTQGSWRGFLLVILFAVQVSVIFSVATQAFGQSCPVISPPIPLNSGATADGIHLHDNNPQVASDGVGTWVATWDVDNNVILFARSTDNGVTWSPSATLNSNGMGVNLSSQVATDRKGTWVAVWDSGDDLGGTIGTDLDVLFSRSIDGGLTWSAPSPLNSNAGTDSSLEHDDYAQLATDGAGTWVVVWTSNFEMSFARSTDDGATWSAAASIGNSRASEVPQIETDGRGTWVAVWKFYSSFNGPTGTDSDILFSRSTDGGITWSSPSPLNTNATTDGGGASPSGMDDYPALTTDGAGTWVAAWTYYGSVGEGTGADQDIAFARSTDGGITWSDPQPLNTNASSDVGGDTNVQLSTDGMGNWLAVWVSTDDLGGTIGTDSDVLFARSLDNGVSWTDPAPFNTDASVDDENLNGIDDDIAPQLSTDGIGNWVAVWNTHKIGLDDDVMTTRFVLPSLVATPAAPLAATGYPHEARKNRYLSFVPDPSNACAPHTYQVTHVGSPLSFFISPPQTTPAEVAGLDYTFVVSDTDPVAAGLLFDFASEPIVHVGGCLIAPGETYEIRATTDGVNFSAPLTVTTAPLPTNGRFWGDAVGVFSQMGDANTTPPTPVGAWTPPDGTMNGFDVTAALRGFQKMNQPDNTWTDVNGLSQDRLTNGNDILRFVNAFSTGSGKEFYPFPTPASCTAGPGMDIPPESELSP